MDRYSERQDRLSQYIRTNAMRLRGSTEGNNFPEIKSHDGRVIVPAHSYNSSPLSAVTQRKVETYDVTDSVHARVIRNYAMKLSYDCGISLENIAALCNEPDQDKPLFEGLYSAAMQMVEQERLGALQKQQEKSEEHPQEA